MGIKVYQKYKKFYDLLNFSHGKYSCIDVFRDFVVMYALSIKNSTTLYEQKDEDAYMQIVKKYQKDEMENFLKLTAELICLICDERDIKDVLGEIYSQILGTSNQNGQVFTPDHIADAIARMTITEEVINSKKIIKVLDPACGSGQLLLAAANVFNSYKISNMDDVFFVGEDIDFICICMSYIQASLYGMSALFILGDSLKDEYRRKFYTPEYFTSSKNQKYNKLPVILEKNDEIINLELFKIKIDYYITKHIFDILKSGPGKLLNEDDKTLGQLMGKKKFVNNLLEKYKNEGENRDEKKSS